MIFCHDDTLVLQTAHTSYVISLRTPLPTGLYWGPTVSDTDAVRFQPCPDRSSFEHEVWREQQEFPVWDGRTFCPVCLKADVPLRPMFVACETDDMSARIHLRDEVSGLAITLTYTVHEAYDVILRQVTLQAGAPLVVRRLLSAAIPLPQTDDPLYAHTLHGTWAGEARREMTRLGDAGIRIGNRKGMSGPDSNPFLLLSTSEREEEGEAYGALLAWSGAWQICARHNPTGTGQTLCGFDDSDFRLDLHAGERLELPQVILCGASHGLGELSRKLHRFERDVFAPPRRSRKVLYNSWEATQFHVRCDEQIRLARMAAEIGCERFVVDDGWFKGRDSDHRGLGDWVCDASKFPEGLQPLISEVHRLNMDFGIWLEPESVNPDSDLFRAHPDRIHALPDREPLQLRNQYLLDMSRPEVEAFVYDTVAGVLSKYAVDYVKWDMNRSFSDISEEQTGFAREAHVLALYRVLTRLRRDFPHVDFEACCGGGARVDAGMLRLTDQFWASDNTDPYDRLLIQEGLSLAYAPVYTSCWVTDTPKDSGKRGRDSLPYKFHVAGMGSLGIGADISHWNTEQISSAKQCMAEYKAVREIVFDGDLYRLQLPSRANLAANLFVSQDRHSFVLFAFLHAQHYGEPCARIRLKGIDPNLVYRNVHTGESYSGSTLMHYGLATDLHGDYDSCMLCFITEEA